jgi:hypothetical protein
VLVPGMLRSSGEPDELATEMIEAAMNAAPIMKRLGKLLRASATR